MSALVRKEIRLVLPAWIAAMLLAIFPVWLGWPGERSLYSIAQTPGLAIYAPFALGALLLGLASFAQELNFGTFSMLLAQPVSRRQLWRMKTGVLAVALGIVFGALCISLYARTESVIETLKATDLQRALNRSLSGVEVLNMLAGIRSEILIQLAVYGGIWTLAAFSSGLWTNLLFRNTSAAFWFSLLVPLGLGLLADKLFGSFAYLGLIATLGAYSLGGFLWARKFFLRVEDTQWTGGLLSFPAWSGSKTDSTGHSSARRHKPFHALLRKEFQLQQVNLLIAGLLLLTHLIVILVRRMSADYFATHRSAAMIWESWPILWLVMPLLIGGVAVAEERKLGTLENFLCLPTTRKREFTVKLFMAMLLGGVLGGAMPLLIEWFGTRIGLSGNMFDMTMMINWNSISLISELLVGSMGLTFLALYASTLTRNLLQALGLAAVLTLVTFALIAGAVAVERFDLVPPLWQPRLLSLITWPVMIATVVLLAFRNFKQPNVSGKIWWRNALTILAALVLSAASTTVIYNRVWEIWMPKEPQPRYTSRPLEYLSATDQTNRVKIASKLESSLTRVAVILPKGSLWLRHRRIVSKNVNIYGVESFRFTGWNEGFVAGSNWREIAVTDESAFGIQADGTLWDLSNVEPRGDDAGRKPQRVGDGNNWKKISSARTAEHFVGLQTDGTLWQWETEPGASNNLSSHTAQPVQVGTDSDWTAICDSPDTSLGVKSDGSIWRWRYIETQHTNNNGSVQLFKNPRRWFSFADKNITPWKLSYDDNSLVVIAEDGSLWVSGALVLENNRHEEMSRCPYGFDWQDVALARQGRSIAISNYQLLNVYAQQTYRIVTAVIVFATEPESSSRIWLAISPCGDDFYALANDGRLCLWKNPDNEDYSENNFLMPSRIKARTVANLLQ